MKAAPALAVEAMIQIQAKEEGKGEKTLRYCQDFSAFQLYNMCTYLVSIGWIDPRNFVPVVKITFRRL